MRSLTSVVCYSVSVWQRVWKDWQDESEKELVLLTVSVQLSAFS